MTNNMWPNPKKTLFSHLDPIILVLTSMLLSAGIIILSSASNGDVNLITKQLIHISAATTAMIVIAQIKPSTWQRLASLIYALSLLALIIANFLGHIGKGAQRWLSVGGMHFQPAELMKFAIPLVLSWYCDKITLPLAWRSLSIAAVIIIVPVILTAKQPDLGTAILLMCTGMGVMFFAGLNHKIILKLGIICLIGLPVLWYNMHDYQRQRVLTFINPEREPLSAGYHIIQSKIAIGSGGWHGKGWHQGTQSQLNFLPEHNTDFIFAVCSEEFGFIGNISLIMVYLLLVLRGLYIAIKAQDTFSRLLASSLSLNFFLAFFINMGMVAGILPVVGLPLPLISYGGSSLLTSMMSFGIIMSIRTNRKLITT